MGDRISGNGKRVKTELPFSTTCIKAPIFPSLLLDYFKFFMRHISTLLICYFTILLIRFFRDMLTHSPAAAYSSSFFLLLRRSRTEWEVAV